MVKRAGVPPLVVWKKKGGDAPSKKYSHPDDFNRRGARKKGNKTYSQI